MRILMVHNHYGEDAPSGENLVFEAEKDLLRSHGHHVAEFCRWSDEVRRLGTAGTLLGGLATPWNPWMGAAVKRRVQVFKPDIVHVHNTFPLISPSIFRAIGRQSVSVLTLHNYRLMCAAAIPVRNGRVCTECLDRKSAWSAMRYGCYRNSRAATLPLAIGVELHRRLGTWRHWIDAFITLSEFQRSKMVNAGLAADSVYVKPNFCLSEMEVRKWSEREPYIVYVGRLKPEKGLETLIRAWQLWGAGAPELRVVGSGELRQRLEWMSRSLPIRFLGKVSHADARSQIAGARLLVMPSEWYETFGLVIAEAFSSGTPAAVSEIGPLPSMVRSGGAGVVFRAGDSESLMHEIRRVWESEGVLEVYGRNARLEYEKKYSAGGNYERLMEIYKDAYSKWRERN